MIENTWEITAIVDGKEYDKTKIYTRGKDRLPQQVVYRDEINKRLKSECIEAGTKVYQSELDKINTMIRNLELKGINLRYKMAAESNKRYDNLKVTMDVSLILETSEIDRMMLSVFGTKLGSNCIVAEGDPTCIESIRECKKGIGVRVSEDKKSITLDVVAGNMQKQRYLITKETYGQLTFYNFKFVGQVHNGALSKQKVVAFLKDGTRILKLSNGEYRRYERLSKDLTGTEGTLRLTVDDIISTNVDKQHILDEVHAVCTMRTITKGVI